MTDNLDYTAIPAVQAIITYLYEEYLASKTSSTNQVYLLFDTVLVVGQIIFVQSQLCTGVEMKSNIHTSPVDYIGASEKTKTGVNPKGEVVIKDFGVYITT